MNICDLPSNTLNLIFGYTDLNSIKNIKPVCKLFNQLITNPGYEYYSCLSKKDRYKGLLRAIDRDDNHLCQYLVGEFETKKKREIIQYTLQQDKVQMPYFDYLVKTYDISKGEISKMGDQNLSRLLSKYLVYANMAETHICYSPSKYPKCIKILLDKSRINIEDVLDHVPWHKGCENERLVIFLLMLKNKIEYPRSLRKKALFRRYLEIAAIWDIIS